MARPSVNIAVLLILVNSGAAFFLATGVAGDWGVAPEVGGDEEINQVQDTAGSLESNSGTGDTLLGLYDAVTGAFSSLVQIVFAGPTMLQNLGVPSAVTAFFFAPMYLIVGADIIYVLSGRLLT